jgi:predicted secreted protein
MHWVVLVGAYIILWFLALQIVLPIGIGDSGDGDEAIVAGTDPGAPTRPRLGLKLTIATAAATVIWAVFYGLVLTKVLDI